MNHKIENRPTMSLANAFRAILALFFLWGFLTCLNDLLVPQLKFIFGLSYAGATVVPVAFFSTCFLFAIPSSRFIHRFGYKRAMVIALLTMGGAALTFLAAATVARFSWFVFALVVLGAGITLLQVAVAPYVASLGPVAEAPARFSMALGFNSLGTMLAPLFGAWLFVRDPAARATGATLTQAVVAAAKHIAVLQIRGPYLFLGLSMVALSVVVALSRLPPLRPGTETADLDVAAQGSVLRHRPLLYGAITAFLYAGAEIGIGSLLVNYLSLPDVGAVTRHTAAYLVSAYWGSATAGRFLGWGILRRFPPEFVLTWCGSLATLFILISVFSHGALAMVTILAVGFCNAMIVPIVVMLSIAGFGHRTAQASSVMVAANIGGGLVPLAMGILADHFGLHHAFLIPVISYGFVIFYALRGSNGHLLNAGPIV